MCMSMGGCKKACATGICMCGEVDKAFINVSACVCVCVYLLALVCLWETKRETLCTSKKKKNHCSLAVIWHFKSQPVEDRKFYENRDSRDGQPDRETGARVREGQSQRKRSGKEKYSENWRENSIKRVRGRGRACAVPLIWTSRRGESGYRGRLRDRAATVGKWLYNTVK